MNFYANIDMYTISVTSLFLKNKRHSAMIPQLLISLLCLTGATTATPSLAKPNCIEFCGKVRIPYPFGIGAGCYLDEWYEITCNNLYLPFLKRLDMEVLNVTIEDDMAAQYMTKVTVNSLIASNCETEGGVNSSSTWLSVDLDGSPFSFSSEANIFTAVGCDNLALLSYGNSSVLAGCASVCNGMKTIVDGCYGLNCCQTLINADLKNYTVNIASTGINNTSLMDCRHAFLVKRSWFRAENTSSLYTTEHMRYVPVVMNWLISNLTDVEVGFFPEYDCYKYRFGYECRCKSTYEGNPYIHNGCQVVKECANCKGDCTNTWERDVKYKCRPNRTLLKVVTLGVSIGVGLLLFLLGGFWMYKIVKRRKEIKRKEKFFKKNGGLLLQQQVSSDEGVIEKTKIFTSKELEKATDNFNENRILGEGGQGTVYKGMLTDGQIVAIKRSKLVDEGQIEQFINEVVILSQINHRNVVKLLGCCLETEVPLLVYEFVLNGTLFDHIHNPNEEFPISWKMRMQIATEAAGALTYLHSSSSMPIYHRDIKSTNILLDDKYRTKVSDFGISRSIAIEQTHLTTHVQGTFGYLDPEYFQSSQFTEKSDVYSFGVVLVELLTGQKPISLNRSQEERSLATHFLLSMKESRLFDILDARVIMEGRKEELIAIANLAKRCLSLNGKKRPTMKEVAIELEGIRMSHVPLTTQSNFSEIQCVISDEIEIFTGASTSMRLGFDYTTTSSQESLSLLINTT